MVTGFFSNILGIGGQAPPTKIESDSDSDMKVSHLLILNLLGTKGLRQIRSGIAKRIERPADKRAVKV